MTEPPKLRKPDPDDMGEADIGRAFAVGVTAVFVFLIGFGLLARWVFS